MKTIQVKLKDDFYPIRIGRNILSQIGRYTKALQIGQDALIITSPVINRLHGKTLVLSLKRAGFSVKILQVPDGEKSKSVQTAFALLQRIAKDDVYKKPFIVAFGGGVIGDLAGFVAATYKRGIPYIQVPTTLLAQIDSAIGGKVAVDLPVGKNLVGAFYQPKMVYSDVALLKTLDLRQVRNGMAEAIKYGIIDDALFFQFLEKNYAAILKYDLHTLEKVVERCSRIKTKVVLADEKETKGIRTILNFGHTLGHAIEAAGKFSLYHHGEAIAIGMRMAADLSQVKGLLSQEEVWRIENLLSSVGLPRKAGKIKLDAILSMMKHDKKFIAGKNRFVLAARIGRVKVVEGLPIEMICRSIKRYLN